MAKTAYSGILAQKFLESMDSKPLNSPTMGGANVTTTQCLIGQADYFEKKKLQLIKSFSVQTDSEMADMDTKEKIG